MARKSTRKSENSDFDGDLDELEEEGEVSRSYQAYQGDEPQECEICDETFDSYENLTTHMKTVHKHDLQFNPKFDHFNNEPLSKTKKTSEKTKESHEVEENLEKSHESSIEKNKNHPYKCPICKDTFPSNAILRTHSLEIHKIPPFRQRKKSQNVIKLQTVEPDAKEADSVLDHDLEPGEVSLRKMKQVSMEDPLAVNVRTPVKIAFTAKSKIKEEEIEIEEHPIEPIEQNEESRTATMNSFLEDSKLFHCEFCSVPFSTITSLNMHKTWHKTNSHSPNMTNEKIVRVSMVDAAKKNDEKIKKIYGLLKEVENQKATASKRTFDQIGESGQSISPKRIKLVQIPSRTLPKNQTIIKGPKKVLRVLLKKTQTSETPPSFSTNDIEDFEKEKTTSIAVGDDHDYTVSETPAKKCDLKDDDDICCPICQEPARKGVIGCDFCEEWYHTTCLNLKKEDVNQLTKRKWKCPKCEANYKKGKSKERTNIDSGSSASSEPVQLKTLQNESLKLVRKDSSNPCLVPNCENQTGLFHPIPSGEIQRRIWLSILGMQVRKLLEIILIENVLF